MAKLSAHGTELLRIEKVESIENGLLKPTYANSDGTEYPSLTTWDRTTRAYMSDGVILEKIDVRFRPDTCNPNGRFYSYGWKRAGKIKGGAAQMHEHIAKVRANLAGQSRWTEVR